MPRSCPICRTNVEPKTPAFPFCSARCKRIDLGNWLDASYRLPDAGLPTFDDPDWNEELPS